MKVISTTDLSRYGNDCYIYESISLTEQFGLYAIINFCKVTGWAEREEVSMMKHTTDINEAKKYYQFYGGILE